MESALDGELALWVQGVGRNGSGHCLGVHVVASVLKEKRRNTNDWHGQAKSSNPFVCHHVFAVVPLFRGCAVLGGRGEQLCVRVHQAKTENFP